MFANLPHYKNKESGATLYTGAMPLRGIIFGHILCRRTVAYIRELIEIANQSGIEDEFEFEEKKEVLFEAMDAWSRMS